MSQETQFHNSSPPRLTPLQAVIVGHLSVTLPMIILLCMGFAVGYVSRNVLWGIGGVLLGAMLAWLWGSTLFPRWTEWTKSHAVDEKRTREFAQRSGLVWRNDKTLDQTQIRSAKRTRKYTGIIVLVILVLLWVYGRPIAFLVLTKWQARDSPRLWIVPTPLGDVSVDGSAGGKFSYLGFEFESPWNEVKTERTGDSYASLIFSSGQGITILRGVDVLRMIRDGAGRESVRNLFGDQATKSNYALLSKQLYMTPRDLHLFSTRQHMAGNSVLLNLKAILILGKFKGVVYSFQTKWLRGFQSGDPKQDSEVNIDAFDAQDQEVEVIIATEPKTKVKLTQAEINRILYTLHPVAGSASR